MGYLCANGINVIRELCQGDVHGFSTALALEPWFYVSRRVGVTWKKMAEDISTQVRKDMGWC